MHPLEQEIQTIQEAFEQGNLSAEEKNYLLQEIRDIRAAQECASDEILFRRIVDICNVAMAVV